ncbi:hypothetical protein ZYGR_0AS06630 [Zygosaccharomyces rouxii]|uniref:Uncharacterized protein n=1 Tax=Zygosaccharomyces rouxii TaxID=4956 RepID=A0A1Q3AHY4_ZYGRO|nr:hypothetical protein ZYGR_0AS06630 [Zygosaccharomyces rouxii]
MSGSQGRKPLNKNQFFKRERVRNARTIRAEAVNADKRQINDDPSSRDLSDSGGMLQLPDFISSRQYEMKQLQLAMHNSKTAGCTRVFQALPRRLRRRAASHNVKRIPKRMRSRAIREMLKNDQQISDKRKMDKNKKSHGLSASQLYRARMSLQLLRLVGKSTSMKLALPEEITASNCHLRTKIRRLRKLIKNGNNRQQFYNNKMGSYDNSSINSLAPMPRGKIKYMKRQKFFSWLPTHVWNAKRSHMMKRWGYHLAWSPTQKCFRATHRIGGNVATSDGALCMDSSFYGTMILAGPNLLEAVETLAGSQSIKKKYRSSKLWCECFAHDPNDSSVLLGPLELLWINDDMVLLRLHPAIYITVFQSLKEKFPSDLTIQDCRYSLSSITLKGSNSLAALSRVLRSSDHCRSFEQFQTVSQISDPNVLPRKTLFAFNSIDPRHLAAPKSLGGSKSAPTVDDVINLQVQFPHEEVDQVLSRLCDPQQRNESYKNQQTLKELAQRRRVLLKSDPTQGHKNCIPYSSDVDPSFPVLIVRRPKSEDWLLILPWFWLLPVWYQLNRIPRVYHMGLRQMQQLNYESSKLYFPDDFPFTAVGHAENSLYNREASNAKWNRKPPSKRLNFDKIPNLHSDQLPSCAGEIGDYFSCDWRLLQIWRNGIQYLKLQGKDLNICNPGKTTQFDNNGTRSIDFVNDVWELYKDISKNEETDLPPLTLTTPKEANVKTPQLMITQTPLQVVPISCQYLERGRPKDNARIYQVPNENIDYWNQVHKGVFRADGKVDHNLKHPLPSVTDLIGFVTSGTFHLGEGRGVANGFIDVHAAHNKSPNYVLVRNVGTNVYRLANWSQISL